MEVLEKELTLKNVRDNIVEVMCKQAKNVITKMSFLFFKV